MSSYDNLCPCCGEIECNQPLLRGPLTLLSFYPRVNGIPQRPSNEDRLRAFRNAVDDQTIMVGNAFRWPRQWRQL